MANTRGYEHIARFDSGLVLPQGAASGLVLTSDAVGKGAWSTFLAGLELEEQKAATGATTGEKHKSAAPTKLCFLNITVQFKLAKTNAKVEVLVNGVVIGGPATVQGPGTVEPCANFGVWVPPGQEYEIKVTITEGVLEGLPQVATSVFKAASLGPLSWKALPESTEFGEPYDAPKYALGPDNILHFGGLTAATTAAEPGTQIAKLPEGFRPVKKRLMVVGNGNVPTNSTTLLAINTDGTIKTTAEVVNFIFVLDDKHIRLS